MSEDFYDDVAQVKSKSDVLINNKVARMAYTTNAYASDQAAGVDAYDTNNEQNIPNSSATDTNDSVLDKGLRAQAASLPRNFLNHFFGRASYNLNKLTDWFNILVTDILRSLAKNGNVYTSGTEYLQYDVCFMQVTENAMQLTKHFIRTSNNPTKLKNVPPLDINGVLNSTHWQLLYPTDSYTQAAGTNNTKIATTAFVKTAIDNRAAPLDAFHLFDPAYPYAKDNPTFLNGIPYASQNDNNAGHVPGTTDGSSWWRRTGGDGSTGGATTNVGINITNGQLETDVSDYGVYKETPADPTAYVGNPLNGNTPLYVQFLYSADVKLCGNGSGRILKNAGNAQGEGIAKTFSIDFGKRGKNTTLQFTYQTTPNYQSGYIGIYLYDITNARIIPLSIKDLPAAPSPALFEADFVSAANSGSYRIIWHVQTTTVTDWAVYVDDINASIRKSCIGAAISDWISFNPTANVTNLPGSWSVAKYRRVGDSIQVNARYIASGAATGTISLLRGVLIPNGLSASPNSQHVEQTVAATLASYQASACWDADTSGYFFTLPGASALWNGNTPALWASTSWLEVNFTVPISQWAGSGTVGLVQNYEEYAYNTSTTATSDSTSFGHGPEGVLVQAFSPTGFASIIKQVKFINPVQPGDKVCLELIGPWVSSQGCWMDASIGASRLADSVTNPTVFVGASISPGSETDKSLYNVMFFSKASPDTTWAVAVSQGWKWRARKTSAGKPGEVPSAPTVTVSGQAGNTATNAAPIWTTKQEDSHNAFNKDTSVFTAPIPGNYLFTGSLYTAHGSTAVNWRFQKDVGSGFAEFTPTRHATDTTSLITQGAIYMPVSARFKLNAGDKIRIVRGGTGDSTAAAQWLEITWLGK